MEVAPKFAFQSKSTSMKNTFTCTLLSLIIGATMANAQTNPTPFLLSSGNYSFTSWATTSPAQSYPANMAFHYTQDPTSVNYNPLLNGTLDFNCAYNLTGRNRIVGLDADGVKFVSVNSAQFANCTDGSSAGGRYVGAAVVGLNTTGRMAIDVDYLGGTIVQGDGNGDINAARIWAIRLQYRVGTTGDFTDVDGPVQYVSGLTGTSANVSGTLPVECNNQAEVQVRFLYFQTGVGVGTRPELRLDEISITSEEDNTVGIDDPIITTLTAFPNPSASGIFTLNAPVNGDVFDVVGHLVKSVKDARSIDLSEKVAGQYVLRTDNGQVVRLMK